MVSEVSECPELKCLGSPEKLWLWLKTSLRLVWVWVLNPEVPVVTAGPGVYTTVVFWGLLRAYSFSYSPQTVPRLSWSAIAILAQMEPQNSGNDGSSELAWLHWFFMC